MAGTVPGRAKGAERRNGWSSLLEKGPDNSTSNTSRHPQATEFKERGDVLLEGVKMENVPEAAFETDNKHEDGDEELKIPEPRCGRRSGVSLA